ncbi:MAG: hypothetical protein [Caudoviricetes sp.]|nr:MAG: hypothetical protein [Caudoviricetes sp.]
MSTLLKKVSTLCCRYFSVSGKTLIDQRLKWCPQRDSNSRPPDYKSAFIPLKTNRRKNKSVYPVGKYQLLTSNLSTLF